MYNTVNNATAVCLQFVAVEYIAPLGNDCFLFRDNVLILSQAYYKIVVVFVALHSMPVYSVGCTWRKLVSLIPLHSLDSRPVDREIINIVADALWSFRIRT
jgi:hypothetical protein